MREHKPLASTHPFEKFWFLLSSNGKDILVGECNGECCKKFGSNVPNVHRRTIVMSFREKQSRDLSKRDIEVDAMHDEESSEQEAKDDNLHDDSTTDNKSNSDTNPTGALDDDIQSIKDALSRKESKMVFRLRALVILVLLLVALSISLAVYLLERNAQIKQFEEAFYGIAGKIIDSLEDVSEAISGLSALALIAAVESKHHHPTENVTLLLEEVSNTHSAWPLVKIDNFQELARNARSLSKSIFVSVNPIVDVSDLIAWDKYVQSDANNWM